MKWMKLFMATLALAMVAGMTAGCNTFRGMGKDVEAGGENMQEAADEVQEEIREN